MRLEQLNYVLKYKNNESKPFSFKSGNGFFSYNGKKTEVNIKESFIVSNGDYSDTIKGYSVLDKLLKEDGLIIVDENNSELIVSYSRPFWQLNDKKVNDEEYEKLLNKIKEFSSDEEEVEEAGSDEIEPHTEPAEPIEHIFGKKYISMRDKLDRAGYSVSEDKNFGFFYKKDNTDNNKLLLDDGTDTVEVVKPQKVDEGKYSYNDGKTEVIIQFFDNTATFNFKQVESTQVEKKPISEEKNSTEIEDLETINKSENAGNIEEL